MKGQQDIVKNPPHGGTSSDPFTISNDLNAVQTVTVWIADGSYYTDRQLVKAIKVVYSDGTDRGSGNQTGTSHTFKFDSGEKVTSMGIWTGANVDRIRWVTNHGRTFDHGGTGGTERPQQVGNGILLGFSGSTNENELVSLGSSFKEDSD
ncbi:unnamed protein product [Clonostachys rosea]|uniref:Jacalin-type lectin domain-containing protein n=1 Tax=Bionectria ochroleuca TaxID=29856 RepID=A0ABY6V406_BIOOC|nr:unnamed protein product [Clonostachys rosea]